MTQFRLTRIVHCNSRRCWVVDVDVAVVVADSLLQNALLANWMLCSSLFRLHGPAATCNQLLRLDEHVMHTLQAENFRKNSCALINSEKWNNVGKRIASQVIIYGTLIAGIDLLSISFFNARGSNNDTLLPFGNIQLHLHCCCSPLLRMPVMFIVRLFIKFDESFQIFIINK